MQPTTKYNKRNQSIDDTGLLYGKVPPQAVELEEAVLGAILIEKDAITNVADILSPQTFYKDAHAIIYATIQHLRSKSYPIDLLTVIEQLRKDGKLEETGGAFYISELTNKIASSENLEYHSRILSQKYIQRELIRISNDITRESYEDTTDVFDLLSMAEKNLDVLKSTIYGSSVNSALVIWDRTKKQIINPPAKQMSIPSILGIRHDLGTVDAFGAKPGTGKTAVMIQGCVEAVKEGYKAGILSLELPSRLLVPKIQHHNIGISAKKIIRNELNDYDKERIFRQDSHNEEILSNIFIDDTPCNSGNIRSKIITLVKKYGCEIVWIDYIQLITLLLQKGQNDTKAMELVMTSLQQTAKELGICIIVLSQLTRGSDVPSMEELRGGGVEQACSKIILLHDENYKANSGKSFLDIGKEIRGRLILIDDKERFDDKHNIVAYYDKIKQFFVNWNDRDTEAYEREITEKRQKKEQEELNIKVDGFDIF